MKRNQNKQEIKDMKTSQKEKEYQSNQWRKNIEEHHNKKTCSCHKNQAEVHPIWFIGWLSGHSETTKTHDNLVVGILLFTGAGAEESAVELCIFALASAAWLFAIAFYELPHFRDCLNFGHPQRLPFHNRVTDLFPTKISWRGQFLQVLQTFAPHSSLQDCPLCVVKKSVASWWNCFNIVSRLLKVELHSSFINRWKSWSLRIHENHKALDIFEFGILFRHILKGVAIEIRKGFYCAFAWFQNL